MRTRFAALGSLMIAMLSGATASDPTIPAAVQCWQLGQEALRDGKVDKAIALYQRSLQLDPELCRNYLSLAAAYSAMGAEDRAVEYLTRYVQKQPDHVAVRAHLAEILLRTQRPEAAREQFERCVADLQARPESDLARLIHCQSRLVELAEIFQDEYAERLHRGIGLYLMACQRAKLPEPDGDLAVQGLLFKAARELSAARLERPDTARPCWYLHQVWSRLGQQQPADRWLRITENTAALADLTRVEKAELEEARHRATVTRTRK
jgi:tetratricopeptide (TPR) repeat protein